MKKIFENEKGITLIALVVTIIILIILASISIKLILGDNGLIKKAKDSKLISDVATAQEKLELVKGPVQLEKYSVNLDDYLEELEKVREKCLVTKVERIDDINAEIIIDDKYRFIAIDEKNGNVKIIYQGEPENNSNVEDKTISLGTIVTYTGKYDGKDHEAIVNLEVVPTDAKIEYSLNGGEFSTIVPKITDIGTYSVSIRASKPGYVTQIITQTIIMRYQTIEELIGKDYVSDLTIAQDSDGNIVIVPQGFKVAEDSGINITQGIVIEDNDIKTGIGNNRGNQYVWIPVGNEIKKGDETINITLGRYIFSGYGSPTLQQSAENYTEKAAINQKYITYDYSYEELETYREGKESSETDGLNTTSRGKQKADGTYEGIKSFIDSVKANGGYYIARYEASYGTDGKANSKVSNSFSNVNGTTPTTEGTLWNNITQINAAKACREMYTTATTDLINSYAWDTALVYIENCSSYYGYSTADGYSINSSLTNTGVNGDEVCKINDMASNTYEWTTEYCSYTDKFSSYPCTFRGGCYLDSQGSPRGRFAYKAWLSEPATYSNEQFSFRSVLYL